ncbi:putative benzoate 4-monooxygenase cytochrome P450 [Lojkania enalia]|uniref:Benzoate 4-monooxygenase cytochrome P450 n=1 Tax=Lojkania enalia TaxID=147567 RepID=A0A9P4JXX4_9PLEO|nr:putative benzoate 4-monooxygenase cytochrome P450 [Didymosphaeria enalia]
MLVQSSSYLVPISAIALVVLLGLRLLQQYARLKHVPGPFLAKLTNFERAYWVWTRRAHEIHINLHQEYGKIVRCGPNMVSVESGLEVEKIYRMRDPLKKSDYYHVILPMIKGKILPGLFATQDEGMHRMLKKPIAGVYSMTNMTSFEDLVDRTIGVFLNQLDARFVNTGAICDWGTWLQYFAFDVVGEMTFSKRLGFLEQGKDVENIMSDIWHWFEYVAVIGQIPWADYIWAKNSTVSKLRQSRGSPMVQFAKKREADRALHSDTTGDYDTRDFLSRFMSAMKKDPSIPPWALTAWTSSNVLAGSDTTAIFLRTMFKNLIEHPESLKKLRQELDEAFEEGRLSKPVTWKQSQTLPYLEACFKEAGRIHPPFGLHLERIVPEGGLVLCGKEIPEGTIVGMNAWVVHRDRDVFGEDADSWRPERWLESDDATRRRMDQSLLTFGAGHRSCLGKHISYLEIYKLVPTILLEYDLELVNPDKAWKIENRWFVPQFGFNVRLRKRSPEFNFTDVKDSC